MKGKNLLGRVSRGLLKRGVVFTSMTRHVKSVVTLSTFFYLKFFLQAVMSHQRKQINIKTG